VSSEESTDTEVVAPTRDAVCEPAAANGTTPRDDGGGPVARPARGTMIERYIVRDLLGEGGMGRVFAAYDPELDRGVAIKLLHADGGQHQSRLLREGKAMAKLSHPNVVGVHDIGIHDTGLFVAMELVDGVTLKAWRAAARRSWREIVEVFVQAARGLEAAHAAGIVHRDFKPTNVLVRKDGRVLVGDFGLARRIDAGAGGDSAEPAKRGADLTGTGVHVGTPAYMSPEQLAGKPVDARTDQFSFCVALHEALYGRRPFADPANGEIGALAPGMRDEDRWVVPAPPDDTDVPARIRRILVRGLAVAVEQRYATMTDLLRELSHDPRPGRRTALAFAAVVLLAGGAVAWLATRGSPAPAVKRISLAGRVLSIELPPWITTPIRASITFNRNDEIEATRTLTMRLTLRNDTGELRKESDRRAVLELQPGERFCHVEPAAFNTVNYWLGFQTHCATIGACSYQIEDTRNGKLLYATIHAAHVVIAPPGVDCPYHQPR
jgi:predicted Ser/Thr protein kinase